MRINVAFEDDDLLVVDKPQGLATTPGRQENLCDLVLRERPGLALVAGFRKGEGGLLNRLDNETGGLVLFAKTDEAFKYFACEMKTDRVVKRYYAVVDGIPGCSEGTISVPLGHSKKSARRMATADGRRALRGQALSATTSWKLAAQKPPLCLLEVWLTKGRRHQIRLHLASIGLPIVGDKLYNKKESVRATRCHLLYCYCVELNLKSGARQPVSVDVPFLKTWNTLAI